MIVIAIVIVFILVWGWIAYEMWNAPLFDENEMPIDVDMEEIENELLDKD
jgi:hypothetical protein